MIMKLCMEQYVLKLYKVYVKDDPELTLTHFKTKSNLAKLVFCTYSRPRYQASVYRTIGPLVSFLVPEQDDFCNISTARKLSINLLEYVSSDRL